MPRQDTRTTNLYSLHSDDLRVGGTIRKLPSEHAKVVPRPWAQSVICTVAYFGECDSAKLESM